MDDFSFSSSEVMAALVRLRSGSTLSAAALKITGGGVLFSATAFVDCVCADGIPPAVLGGLCHDTYQHIQ